jgi:hypothetical protein
MLETTWSDVIASMIIVRVRDHSSMRTCLMTTVIRFLPSRARQIQHLCALRCSPFTRL